MHSKQISNYSLEWFRAVNQSWWLLCCIANLLGCSLCCALQRADVGEGAFRVQNANGWARESSSLASLIPAAFKGVEHQSAQMFGLGQEVSATLGLWLVPKCCLICFYLQSRSASAVNKDGLECVSCFQRHVPSAVHRFWPQARLELLLLQGKDSLVLLTITVLL